VSFFGALSDPAMILLCFYVFAFSAYIHVTLVCNVFSDIERSSHPSKRRG
jgi:hypothetical protein